MSDSPPEVSDSSPKSKRPFPPLGAESPAVEGDTDSSGRPAPKDRYTRESTREQKEAGPPEGYGAKYHEQHGGVDPSERAPETVESTAPPRSLAQHADKSSDVPFAASEQGSAYTHRQRTRRKRWSLLETLWRESSVDRCRACRRWRADREKGYEVCIEEYDSPDGEGTERKAYVGNIQTCRSSWGCPVCAAKVRQKRAVQIAKAAAKHMNDGGGIEFLMLTIPHDLGDPLEGLLDGLKAGWDGISKGYARRKDWDEFGIEHYVRSLDLTWSERAGWHPHYHVLLFTEEPLTDQQRRDLEQRFYRRWSKGVQSEGWREPNRQGVRFRSIDSEADATTVAYYTAEGVLEQHREVGEEPDRMGMGWEMTRHDLKSAAGMTPWDILEHLRHFRRKVAKAERIADEAGGFSELTAGDVGKRQVDHWREAAEQYRRLWHEYEQATKGRRSIQPSRGLWKDYGVEEGELDDEELADEDHDGEVLAEVDATTMEWCRRIPGGYAALLEAAEDGTYILRAPSGRIEATGERARKAGAEAIGLTEYLSAVRKHYEAWKRG